jgi:hypothetical protein
MAKSSKISVTTTRQKIIGPPWVAFVGVGEIRVYLFNMETTANHTAYVGDETVQVGEGIAIPSGPLVDRKPTELVIKLSSSLYVIADTNKECDLGILVIS